METDVVTDEDIAALGRQAEKDQDVRLEQILEHPFGLRSRAV
jgi:hypothetical protein